MKNPRISGLIQMQGSFAEFALRPFTLFRAVRKWRANGLRMTDWERRYNVSGLAKAEGRRQKAESGRR